MATIGLSKPYYAKYNYDGSKVTRSGGGVLGKYTDININLNGGNENVLYGDNAPAESDNAFTGGKASLGTTELLPDVAHDVLGTTQEPIDGMEGAKWNVYNENQKAPYLSVGGVVKKKVSGAIKWMAFILEKIQFTTPGLQATTQGESITWQTPTLEANIMRSDADGHPWYRDSTLFDTEAEAEKAVKSYLKITDPVPVMAEGKTAVAEAAKS